MMACALGEITFGMRLVSAVMPVCRSAMCESLPIGLIKGCPVLRQSWQEQQWTLRTSGENYALNTIFSTECPLQGVVKRGFGLFVLFLRNLLLQALALELK